MIGRGRGSSEKRNERRKRTGITIHRERNTDDSRIEGENEPGIAEGEGGGGNDTRESDAAAVAATHNLKAYLC